MLSWLLRRRRKGTKKKPKTAEVLEQLERQLRDADDRIRVRDQRVRRVRRLCVQYGALLTLLLFAALVLFRRRSDSDNGGSGVFGGVVRALLLLAAPAAAYFAALVHGAFSARARAADGLFAAKKGGSLYHIYTHSLTHPADSAEAEVEELRTKLEAKLEELRKETDFDRTQELIQRLSSAAAATPHKGDASSMAASSSAAAAAPQMTPVAFGGRAAGQQQQQQLPFASPLRLQQQPAVTPQHHQQRLPQQQQQQQLRMPPQTPVVAAMVAPQPPQTPATKSWIDRALDVLVGGDHADSYALICGRCGYHNGFVPASEYEGAQFRCRACSAFNVKRLKGGSTAAAPQQAPRPAAAAAAPAPPAAPAEPARTPTPETSAKPSAAEH